MKKEENIAVSAMRTGFTLIEIIVAVAIIGILGTVATISITRSLDKAKVTAATEAVNNIHAACETYKMSNKKYPSDLNALVTGDDPYMKGGEGALEDPWGNNYKLVKKGKGIAITSAGPDGEEGTEDDIDSSKVAKTKD